MSKRIDLQALVDNAGDGIIAADAQGVIVLWNPAAERIFGYPREQALGRSLDLIIPERHRKRHWDGYQQVMKSGDTRYGGDQLRVPALHRDGSRISIAFTVALLFDDRGEVESIAAIVRDETRRFAEERALKKRLAELEAQPG